MGKLDGKVAIITGASHGLGRGIALTFAREGSPVVLAARSRAQLEATAAEIQAAGGTAVSVPTDLSDEAQIENLFAEVMRRFGRVDVLVNNAALLGGAPLDQFTSEMWNHAIAVNLTAPFLCTRAAFRIMKSQRSGRIVNIASISAQRVRPFSAAYSATKHALWGLTQVTALEGRDCGVVCSCIFPGNIRTEARSNADSELNREPMMSVAEVAEAVLFIAAQPPHVNLLELTMLPAEQQFLGRG
jgi:NAD(P)-dependent dehydrogenase (short-subunit alcohol dehydrogenase family)